MGGSYSKPVTIDIGRYPGDSHVHEDGKINLTESYYPNLEGTYRQVTHTAENSSIKNVVHKGKKLYGIDGLGGHKSVSVYYWTLDTDYSKPLIIQLGGEGSSVYYTTSDSDAWSQQGGIDGNLKQSLDKQNCERNDAHTVKLSEKNGTPYKCPSCSKKDIQISFQSELNYNYYMHYGFSSGSTTLSLFVSSFMDDNQDQVGLPSAKNIQYIFVYWSKSGDKPLLICYQQTGSGQLWYRRNSDSDNTWSEIGKKDPNLPNVPVDNTKIPALLQRNPYHPNLTPDLSSTSGTYSDTTTGIGIAVRGGPTGNGYWKNEHSLKGGRFVVKSVMSGRSKTLGDITSGTPVNTITFFYWGEVPDENRLLLVQLGEGNIYYTWNYGDNWTSTSGSPSDLIRTLDKQNCIRNSAHVADISHYSTASYYCYACSRQSITTVSSDEAGGKYKKVVHTISSAGSDKIGTVDEGHPRQNGIKIPDGITTLVSFHYPKAGNKALLIHLGSSWYKRKGKDTSEWEEVKDNAPSGPTDSSKILKLLKTINGESEGLSGGAIAGISIAGVGGTGLGGLAIWKGPALIAKLIARL